MTETTVSSTQHPMGPPTAFDDRQTTSNYARGAARMVPALSELHRMVGQLLAERVGPQGRVLVLGAGGGMELKAFADAHPGWHFDGVDPSEQMLALAERTLGSHSDRVRLHRGTIDDAPEGPFDGATCLLTLHFLDRDERRRTLGEVRRRLFPDAPFVMAHHSFPQDPSRKERWLGRFADYAAQSGMPSEQARSAAAGIGSRLPSLSPSEDEALMREAGFEDVELFYAALTFRGWVAYREALRRVA